MIHFLTGVSDDLVEECCLTMLHDNMNISCIMVYSEQVEKISLRRKNREAKRVKSFGSGSSRGGWKFKTSLNSRRGSPIKFLPNFESIMIIGFLTLSLKSEK